MPLVLEPLEGRLCPFLKLTQAGVAAGFGISNFVTDVPAINNNIGPLGIAFPDSGGVLLADRPGNVRLLPDDSDGQSADWVVPLPTASYGLANATALAKVGANIYMTQQAAGKVVQIHDDGTPNRVISTITDATAMIANPTNGHLLVDDPRDSHIFDVDPIVPNSTPQLLLTVPGTPDGLALTADGLTLYVARNASNLVVGYNTATAKVAFGPYSIPGGPDGIALGTGRFSKHLYVNTNGGKVFDLDTAASSPTPIAIADSGSRGDFVTLDPNDGSLLVTQTDRVVRLKFPTGPATSFRISASANFFAGKPFGVSVTALDSYGAVAIGYTGTVTFTSSDPYPGLFSPDYTFTQSDKGTHNFGAVLFTAGTQILTVQDKADSSVVGTATIAVSPAPANHLVLGVPSSTTSGTPFDVTITALDPYGNVDTNYTGTVNFASTDADPGVMLPADYTFQSSEGGTHNFPAGVTLITPGDQTITIMDTAYGTITGGATINVSPPPVPPPGGSANRSQNSIVLLDGVSASSGQRIVLVDQLFAAVDRNQPAFLLARHKNHGSLPAPVAGAFDLVP